jgi:hypothetical protein
MANRTNSRAVEGVLARDWDGKTSLIPYIQSANSMVNRVAQFAPNRGFALTRSELELIERWLAAHFYCCSDQPFSQKTTDGASGTFQGKTAEEGLCGTKYGQMAVRLDVSGVLNALDKRIVAKGHWLGSVPLGCPPVDNGPGLGPY